MTSVTPPSRSMRMNPLGLKSRAAWAPAASAVPMRAGRLKLTSRPPPAAAPALRKVRRDRVCTAVEINSRNGFPQQDHTRSGGCWTGATSYKRKGRSVRGVHARAAIVAVPAQRRAGDVETAARVVDIRDELADRAWKRVRPAVLAERIGEPEHRALGVVDHVLVDVHDALDAVEDGARVVERHARDRPRTGRLVALFSLRPRAARGDLVADVDGTPHEVRGRGIIKAARQEHLEVGIQKR